MTDKFRVGDKVNHKKYGYGTVRGFSGDYYIVEFEKAHPEMHTCNGSLRLCKGRYCDDHDLEFASNVVYPNIHIVFNPKKNLTIAKFVAPDGKILKTCVAKRDPDDAWDSYMGANIAIARLFNKNPKWNAWDEEYNMGDTVEWNAQANGSGKFVCINIGYGNGKRIFTKGKIYEVKDYTMRDDNGVLVNTNAPEFENYFLKIVE